MQTTRSTAMQIIGMIKERASELTVARVCR